MERKHFLKNGLSALGLIAIAPLAVVTGAQ